MTLLVCNDGERAEIFTEVNEVADLSLAQGPILVPLEVIDTAIEDRRNERLGLTVSNTASLCSIEPYLGAVDLISIVFPSFSDGRGLSLAKRLRRAGFKGTLRAAGPLIADQFAEALACGFDEVKLPDALAARQPLQQWLRAKGIVVNHYQSGYGEGESILQKRLAARKAAG